MIGTPAKAAIAVLAMALLAACGADEGPRVATAEQPATVTASPTTSGSATPPSGDYDKALRYTRCLTDNGAVTPDPLAGEPLVTYNRITRGETVEVMALRHEAHDRCKQHLPDSWPVRWSPAEIVRSRAYLACMRDKGIPMADPDANGMVDTPTDESWQTTPEYDAAVAACRHLVDDPANDHQPNNG